MVCLVVLPSNSVSSTISCGAVNRCAASGRISYVDSVAPFLGDVRDCAKGSGRKHDFVVVDQRIFIYTAENVASRDVVSDLERS
jgi:hypothetical protein